MTVFYTSFSVALRQLTEHKNQVTFSLKCYIECCLLWFRSVLLFFSHLEHFQLTVLYIHSFVGYFSLLRFWKNISPIFSEDSPDMMVNNTFCVLCENDTRYGSHGWELISLIGWTIFCLFLCCFVSSGQKE